MSIWPLPLASTLPRYSTIELFPNQIVGIGRDIDPTDLTGAFHTGRDIDGISPNVKGIFSSADDTCHHRTGMHANPKRPLEGGCSVSVFKIVNLCAVPHVRSVVHDRKQALGSPAAAM